MPTPAKKTITLIPGDGVGREITQAVCEILKAAEVPLNWEICEAGSIVFKKGLATGVPLETLDSIAKNGIVLKGPLETPIGYGEKSANVTLRKVFETYGNIRPVKSFTGIVTPYQHQQIDLVVIRENLEDLYAGLEYAQTPNSVECLKLLSRQGCEQIIRLAFEFALAERRTKIHCVSKANIMKLTEGLFKSTFEEVAKDYPILKSHHILVDNCAHQLVKNPTQFDVLVTTNMNGDILSDLTSALVGGLGFAPSANLGQHCAIFESVHGSAPKYAGQNLVNPTAFILAAVMMLRHLHYFEAATRIEQAVRQTLAQGIVTQDAAAGKDSVSTSVFTQHVITQLEKSDLHKISNPEGTVFSGRFLDLSRISSKFICPQRRAVLGLDIFIETTLSPTQVGQHLQELVQGQGWQLEFLASRGLKVYPCREGNYLKTDKAISLDLLQCRLLKDNPDSSAISTLLASIDAHYPWMHLEKLQAFEGVKAFSDSHG